MIEVLVPRENVNDESVIIIAIHVQSGAKVKKGDCIFEIETSKTNVEIESPADSVIHHDLSLGDVVQVGSLLCRLDIGGDTVVSPLDRQGISDNSPDDKKSSATLSKAAIKRARELGLDPAIFKDRLISVADVERQALIVNGQSTPTPSDPAVRRNNGIVIIGGGGHAKMCIDILKQRKEYQIVGIVDPKKPIGTMICGVPIIGDDTILEKLWKDGVTCAVNGVGSVSDPLVRKKLYLKLKNIGFYLPNLVHPSVVVEPSVKMGEGNQIMMGACVGSDAVIGDNCIVNSGSIISHDSVLEDHSHVAPGAILAGSVLVGEAAVIGMGVTVYFGINVGKGAVINNGSNIFRNIKDNEVVK